jgi:outer membrane protein assembly factor BamB
VIKQLLAMTMVVSVVVGCAPRPIHFMREGPAPVVVPKQSSWKVTPGWRFYTGETYDSADIPLRPVVGGSRIFAAEPGGKIYALEADTGDVVWQIDSKLDLSAGVGFGHGVVVVASAEGQLLALDPTDGNLLWQSSVGAEVLARPIVADEHIIVRAGDGQVIGVDKNSGTIRWRLRNSVPSLSVRGLSVPVQVNEIVVVGYASGHLSGIDIQSGRELWKTPISRPGGSNQIDRLIDIDADPLIAGSQLFVAAYQDKVYAISLTAQKVQWSAPRSTLRNLAVSDSELLITLDNGVVMALDPNTGTEVWKQARLRGRGVTNPIAIPGSKLCAVGDYQGYVHVMDVSTGALKGRGRARAGAILATFIGPGFEGFYTLSERGMITSWLLDEGS